MIFATLKIVGAIVFSALAYFVSDRFYQRNQYLLFTVSLIVSLLGLFNQEIRGFLSHRSSDAAERLAFLNSPETKDALNPQRCLNTAQTVPEEEDPSLEVSATVDLNVDGTVNNVRDFSVRSDNPSNLQRIGADAVRRAIYRCAPYELPPDKHNWWKTVTITYSPSRMTR